MRCVICGQEYGQLLRYCPNCGVPVTPPAQPSSQEPLPFVAVPNAPPFQPGFVPAYFQPRPAAGAQIALSIINIVCCGFFVSMVLGIIALIYTIMAKSENEYQEAVHAMKIAKTLNIIGVIIAGISLVIYIILFVGAMSAISSGYAFN